jgi:hypothetical protein
MPNNLISPIYRLRCEVVDRVDAESFRRADAAQIQRARIIARSLGIAVAARYLRKRGWSLTAARWILLHKQ